ncbi:MAG: glycoside hydrolase family 13 protein [Candidatus Nanopelagicales bacterium]
MAAVDHGVGVLLDEPHHDGSALYFPRRAAALGDAVDVYLRVPHGAGVSQVLLRQVHDGEAFETRASVARTDDCAAWWSARLVQVNPVVRYRFLTDGGPFGYRWITAAGPVDRDPTDAHDFRTVVFDPGPDWLRDAVAYQIFPDRFARGALAAPPDQVPTSVPDWAMPATWDDATEWRRPGAGNQFYGGDLVGVAEKLDYLADLGVTLLYLTPVFPAPSNHRYNASTFDEVDPLLGGDQAFAALIAAAHERGMRVIGDFTTNHTGSDHDWFRAAQANLESEEAGFYFFGDGPQDYVGWFGVRTLPKLDHGNPDLRRRMITGPDSPLRRYLRPPFSLDGWRIDVANMTARHGPDDRNADVAREVRCAVLAERPEAYLVAEHFHDYTPDVGGDGWHGVMNYSGFTFPLWRWLGGQDAPSDPALGLHWRDWPRLPAAAAVATMRDFSAVPWGVRQDSFNAVSSHDTARIASITGDPALVEVALAAVLTFPGVPMIFAGDEIAMEGRTGEDARRPMPWHIPGAFDHATRAVLQRLIDVRQGSEALRHGSMRWAFADSDRMLFLRETADETVLVLLARGGDGTPISLETSAMGLQSPRESDTLYSAAPLMIGDGCVTIPGHGPAVGIWRWADNGSHDKQRKRG